MSTIDLYPTNAERILTTVESMMITKKEYMQLKEISKTIRKYAEEKFQSEINSCGIVRYYIEYTIRNSQYRNLPSTQKEIIIANVILPDDTKVADVLNKNNFTIEHLKAMLRFRSLLKNILLNDSRIDTETARQFAIYKQFVNKIIAIFKLEFGIDNQTLILNRICEMIETCPLYFDTKIDIKSRKR